MQKYAVIVAGGSGTRMASALPKQFLALDGLPILMHTLSAFDFEDIKIILVLPEHHINHWNELLKKHLFHITHRVVEGGETRFHSVKNGIDAIEEEDALVAIHDGVRPLIDKYTIGKSFEVAQQKGNAVVSIGLKDSIRSVSPDGNQQEDRSKFRLIQTPQTFQLSLIREAFQQGFDPLFTDDASVLEKAGHAIHLIEGNYQNIKITTPDDLLIAESFMQA